MEKTTPPHLARCLVRFWGVRGSIPTPGPDTVEYGGNTACIEVRADGELIVLDAGTGIRLLGLALGKEFQDRPIVLTLLISHTHWDHIQGFPFFAPAYDPKNHLRIIGFDGARVGLASTLSGQMESPYFPVQMDKMPSNLAVEELDKMRFNVGKVEVVACAANHPGSAVGYRLNTSGGSVVYVPDNETIRNGGETHGGLPGSEPISAAETRRRFVDFIRGADVLIIDAQYDEEEFQAHRGWGHGCVTDVVDLALEAGVHRLFLFHHDPMHDDDGVAHLVDVARHRVADRGSKMIVAAAREGAELVVG